MNGRCFFIVIKVKNAAYPADSRQLSGQEICLSPIKSFHWISANRIRNAIKGVMRHTSKRSPSAGIGAGLYHRLHGIPYKQAMRQ